MPSPQKAGHDLRVSSGKERSVAGSGAHSEWTAACIYPKDELKERPEIFGRGCPRQASQEDA